MNKTLTARIATPALLVANFSYCGRERYDARNALSKQVLIPCFVRYCRSFLFCFVLFVCLFVCLLLLLLFVVVIVIVVAPSNSILPADFKFTCRQAQMFERFVKEAFEICCCQTETAQVAKPALYCKTKV